MIETETRENPSSKSRPDYVWKVLFIGAGGAGKTTFFHRYLTNAFLQDTRMTIGCSHHSQLIERGNITTNLVVWDLSGQERFKPLHIAYSKGCAAALLFYDLSLHSPDQLEDWPSFMRKCNNSSSPIILVGTKADLISYEQLLSELETMKQLAMEHDLLGPIITSSKMGVNIKETIDYLVDYLLFLDGSCFK